MKPFPDAHIWGKLPFGFQNDRYARGGSEWGRIPAVSDVDPYRLFSSQFSFPGAVGLLTLFGYPRLAGWRPAGAERLASIVGFDTATLA